MQKKINQLISNRWIMTAILAAHCSLFISISANAQSFTQRIQQNSVGNARVVIHQDAAIDEVVNGRLNVQEVTHNAGQTDRQQTNRQQRTDNGREVAREEEQRADSLTQDPQRTHKVMGYRIQVFVGGKTRADKQKAEQTASSIRGLFPEHKVYVHFYSPRWICRMGNFRTLAEAREVLDKVVQMGYDTATLVRGQVTVPY